MLTSESDIDGSVLDGPCQKNTNHGSSLPAVRLAHQVERAVRQAGQLLEQHLYDAEQVCGHLRICLRQGSRVVSVAEPNVNRAVL